MKYNKTNNSFCKFGNIIPLLYSIYFNYRYLPFSIAKKIPILISPKVRIGYLNKKSISLPKNASFGMVRFGLNCSRGIEAYNSYLSVADGAYLIFKGKTKLSSGISIRIDAGQITIGANAFFNANCIMRCTNNITFGDRVLVGWNVSFITDDGHIVFIDGVRKEREKPIVIGNHVWIASDTKIAKGTFVNDDSIVAQNSLVNTSFFETSILIGGVPAKVIKHNVAWEKYLKDEKNIKI